MVVGTLATRCVTFEMRRFQTCSRWASTRASGDKFLPSAPITAETRATVGASGSWSWYRTRSATATGAIRPAIGPTRYPKREVSQEARNVVSSTPGNMPKAVSAVSDSALVAVAENLAAESPFRAHLDDGSR